MLDVYLVDREEYRPSLASMAPLLISNEEAQRAAAFKRASDRLNALCDRMMLRLILANKLCISDPKTLRIAQEPGGKPYLPNSDLHFNLSHSNGFLAVALAFRPVGIDIERVNEQRDGLVLAQSFWTEFEAHWLARIPKPNQASAFTQLWSLKEAHLKRLGMGISDGINRVSLARDNGNISLYSQDGLACYFSTARNGYSIALAAEHSQSPRLSRVQVGGELRLTITSVNQFWQHHECSTS